MKEWSDLEERYQDMRLADPKSAQTFKQKMTARFQVVKNLKLSPRNRAKLTRFFLLDIGAGARGGGKCRETSIGRNASTACLGPHQST
jgi:hypothetical protein